MITLTDEQKFTATAVFKTAAGNDARVDGVPVWSTSDENVATIQSVSEDGLTAVIFAGVPGVAQIRMDADADLDADETRTITGLLDVEVRPSEAVTALVVSGAPEPK